MIPEIIKSPYQHEVTELGLPNCPFCGKNLIFKSHAYLAFFTCVSPRISKNEPLHSYTLEYHKIENVWKRLFIAAENNYFRITHYWIEKFVTVVPMVESRFGNSHPRMKELDYKNSKTYFKTDWSWENAEELINEIRIVVAFE